MLGMGQSYPQSQEILTRSPPFSSSKHDTYPLPTKQHQPCLTCYIFRDIFLCSHKFVIPSHFMMWLTGSAASYFRHMFPFLFWHPQHVVSARSRSNLVILQHSSLTATCVQQICPLLTSQQRSSSFCFFPNLHQRFSVKVKGLSIHIPLLQLCASSAALFHLVIPLLCCVNSPSSLSVHNPVVLCKISSCPVPFPQFLQGSDGPWVLVAALSSEPTWDTRIWMQQGTLESRSYQTLQRPVRPYQWDCFILFILCTNANICIDAKIQTDFFFSRITLFLLCFLFFFLSLFVLFCESCFQ